MADESSRRIVSLDRVQQNNIVVEDLDHLTEDTVFCQEYRQAADIINRIIKFNSTHKDANNHNRTEYQTAVPFIGDRGTGKTSAMYTVFRRLEENPDGLLALSGKFERAHFICFEMIDINSMKVNENLMEIVLSRMLRHLKVLDAGLARQDSRVIDTWHNRLRSIYTRIDSLSRAFSRMHCYKNLDAEEQGLAGLQKISDTQDAVADFRALVCEYTDAIRYLNKWDSPCYLVFALDDIDMFHGANRPNRTSQFALLEQIYDYLRIPNTLVLLTFNERILKRNCISHYHEAYFNHDPRQQCTADEREEIASLTRQFLSKLFPQEQRIYMPNFLLVDATNSPHLYIVPLINNANTPFPPFDKAQDLICDKKGGQKPRAISVKEFMLRLLAYKTGVYFDIHGTKMHFLEPRNLRELGTMLQVVYPWPNPEDHAEPERIRAENRGRFLNYLRNQFAGEYLSLDAYRNFQNMSTLPLVRQSRTLVDDVRRYRMTMVRREDEFGFLRMSNRDRWKYSYGELTHNIYYSTRVHGDQGTLYSKEYIHCILGSHSVILNQTLADDNDSYLLEFVGSSIGGRWANNMLPRLNGDGMQNSLSSVGSCSMPVRSFLRIRIPDAIQTAIMNCHTDSKEQLASTKKEIQHFVEALTLVGLFFTGYPPAGLKIRLDAHLENRSSDRIPVFYLESESEDHICFNALNPFLNLYAIANPENAKNTHKYLSYILQKISKLVDDFPLTTRWTQLQSAGENARITLERASSDPKKGGEILVHAPALQEQARLGEEARELLEKLDGNKSSLERFKLLWTEVTNELKKSVICEETIHLSTNPQLSGDADAGGDSNQDVRESNIFTLENQDVGLTLPLHHFDMMYNILKRVASVSYHDIPEEVHFSEAYSYFGRLYENIGYELMAQDEGYGSTNANLASKYYSSYFYKAFTAKKENSPYYIPYFKELFNEVIQNILVYNYQNEKNKLIPNYD